MNVQLVSGPGLQGFASMSVFIFHVCFLIYLDAFCSVSLNSMVKSKIHSIFAARLLLLSLNATGHFLAGPGGTAAHHGGMALQCACLTTAVLQWQLCSAPCLPNILRPTHQCCGPVRCDEALAKARFVAFGGGGAPRQR
jgi:hypothetical protein